MKKDELFDFDTEVERRSTASLKWEKYKGQDVIPLWVADMDFRSPPAVIRALQQRVAYGIFGYPVAPDELNEVVVAMLRSRYDWKVKPEWLIWLPGLVTGINVACRAVGDDGDDVMTAVPVYPPFLTAPAHFRRNLIKVALKEKNNRWALNLDLLEQAITAKTRLFIFCNPHNPIGRVYTRDEIGALTAICQKHDIIVCSDEIHCDLILDGEKRHVPTATLDPEIAARTIALMSPSKTFNLPGLGCAFAVISEKNLRKRFKEAMAGIVPGVNVLGYTAALAAFKDCSDWQAALLEYLRVNRNTVEQAVGRMPPLSMAPVEATYLAWIDMRAAGMKNPSAFFKDAGVGLQDGIEFGAPGFVRLNFGCPRSLLEEALNRMASAMADVQ
ncbi:MAG: PatB family C-S lyase [Deltaproteobacteria bacterium]|nr:PatB family C-S lyase [Deltaproteobacteria bacterium]